MEDALAVLLLDLQPLPVLADALGRLRLDVSEDVRVARDQLRGDVARDRLEVASPALGQEQREEVRLEEQVAELVEELRVVTRERRIRDLVGLLDRVRHDRALGLLAIPRAVAAEALGQLLELDERVRRAARLRGRRVRGVERGAGIGGRLVRRSGKTIFLPEQ